MRYTVVYRSIRTLVDTFYQRIMHDIRNILNFNGTVMKAKFETNLKIYAYRNFKIFNASMCKYISQKLRMYIVIVHLQY